MNGWCTYLVTCADGTLYCGVTNNIVKRVLTHNAGKGAKYTKPKTRRPVKLEWFRSAETKGEALRMEFALKQLTREQKLEIVAGRKRLADLIPTPIKTK